VNTQHEINFARIKKAIEYIDANFKNQPSLDEIASAVALSPTHFQKMFSTWAGVSPKRFQQFMTIQYAKSLIKAPNRTLFDVGLEAGLSSSGRLHDLFVKIEAMTPGQYKNGGKCLTISYSFYDAIFGPMLMASTERGICHMAFVDQEELGLKQLQDRFPNANFVFQKTPLHQVVQDFMAKKLRPNNEIPLHVKGTDFQINVWQALLNIPEGCLSTYGKLATDINNPKASRAVGTAIGSNPIAFLIPCHRVIQATGKVGGYMWGPSRKKCILGWEAAQNSMADV